MQFDFFNLYNKKKKKKLQTYHNSEPFAATKLKHTYWSKVKD